MNELNFNIKSLENLLSSKKDDSSDEDEPIKGPSAKLGPGSIGPSKKKEDKPQSSIYGKNTQQNIFIAVS